MTKKTSPLSDESTIAQATLLTMLDDLKSGVDVIEACKNAAQRAEAITALRVMIEEVRQAHRLTSDIVYYDTHKKGRTVAARTGGNAKADKTNAFARAIIPYLIWDSLPKKGRPTKKEWLKGNLDRILEECGYKHFIGDADETLQVERWLNPKQRPKSLQPKL
jgi:hypothetical protein